MPSFRQLSAIATLLALVSLGTLFGFVQRWQGAGGSAGVVSLQGAGANFSQSLKPKMD